LDWEQHSRSVGLGILALFFGIALIRVDLVMEVSYQAARVERVQVGPVGRWHQQRKVIVRLGDAYRVITTSDPLIPTPVGDLVCVAETRMLLRSFTRYGLAYSVYCPGLRRGANPAAGQTAGPALVAPGS
jgi:hypothetical protein